MKRNHFLNNHRIIGILNEQEKYEIKFDFENLMSIHAKIALILGVIFSIVMLIKGNWIIPILLIVVGLIIVTSFKIKGKKEMEIFTSKYLEFYKTEYD
ncbi:hypothetical protein [Flavisericum labens]|uniref:hypothetical protein n=1 Tax=Flavisericum labens TaxID=3377112 RepID=UPI00387B16FF